MVYTLSLRHLSFKQNISDLDVMLEDQKSTYAILKYCKEVPELVYMGAMDELAANIYLISDKRLARLVSEFLLEN